MAESTLSMTYDDFAAEVARKLGYTYDSTRWTTDETAEIDRIVQAGLRQFYLPPAVSVSGEPPQVHHWSFLYPITTLEVDGTASDGTYDLPDDFAGMMSDAFYFDEDEGAVGPIKVISPVQVMKQRQSSTTSGTPQFAAVQPVAPTASAGQRFQVQFWPTPTACTLKYQYRVRVDKISSSNPYPYGGTDHSETILESCLAKAESRVEESQGVHKAEFMERLKASIDMDRRAVKGVFLGRNLDRSDETTRRFERLDYVSYDGTVYRGD